MEDAIGLADALASRRRSRRSACRSMKPYASVEVLKLQNAARNSTEWFENVARYAGLPPEQFAYSLLTRSQRIGHENLRLRDTTYVERVERWFARRGLQIPPMFTPFRLRGLELRNRVVVSPMDMYSAVDGMPNDFHLVHLGARALGGAGLVFTEMTCVTRDGRISPGCTGMYLPRARARRGGASSISCTLIRRQRSACSSATPDRKARPNSCGRGWTSRSTPKLAGRRPVGDSLRSAQSSAARTVARGNGRDSRCVRARRDDGRSRPASICSNCIARTAICSRPLSRRCATTAPTNTAARSRTACVIRSRSFAAMRAVWPADRPISVRISATDWVEGGISGDDSVEIARAFKNAGADLIDVSTGQTSPDAQTGVRPHVPNALCRQDPQRGRYRDDGRRQRHRRRPSQRDSGGGRADFVALGRPHLADAAWTLHAAAQLGYADAAWPLQYLPGNSSWSG